MTNMQEPKLDDHKHHDAIATAALGLDAGQPCPSYPPVSKGGGPSFRIKNWEKFQHYKDRDPFWIKLYRDLLDDVEWFELEPADAKFLIGLWLLAAEDHGALPDVKTIAFRLRSTVSQALSHLRALSHWLEPVASDVLADCYQDASLEKEKEKEKSKRERREEENSAREGDAPAEKHFPQTPILKDCQDYAAFIGISPADAEAFHDHYAAQGWKLGSGQVIADWRAAMRRWKVKGQERVGQARNGFGAKKVSKIVYDDPNDPLLGEQGRKRLLNGEI
jgi:hypothetical protein